MIQKHSQVRQVLHFQIPWSFNTFENGGTTRFCFLLCCTTSHFMRLLQEADKVEDPALCDSRKDFDISRISLSMCRIWIPSSSALVMWHSFIPG